ncbi:hypothetical protein DAPPUDRAFT_253784 [Daphnia pulex]|uniref:Uncharacterized protein n=1 Tax=Daphnia pulex TaxID=6669 RepID=E9H5E5_DAPPU|nr:hypothetical protein DAPPUDRAFT_253784 [Daphnia pulex]|eukprot:EFX72947.1 hypothetical protein DAPPUDRAFT_253784 [Daphnia pulex]
MHIPSIIRTTDEDAVAYFYQHRWPMGPMILKNILFGGRASIDNGNAVSPIPSKKKTTPIIALEVPKPAHLLDLNLFEPESPEVEPVFLEESEEEQEPRVVVEFSYAGDDELLTEFNKQNLKAVTSWYLQHYTGDRKCRMLAQLVHLIKTNPIYDGEGSIQAMSPGHIAFKILHTAFVDEEGNPTVLEPRQRQALFDLIFFVLYHFLEISMTADEDERMVQAELAKNFLELLMAIQELVPLEDFIKHPGLLQFVAKSSLEKIPSYLNFDLVRQDMEIAEHLHQTLGDFNQRKGADSIPNIAAIRLIVGAVIYQTEYGIIRINFVKRPMGPMI